MQDGFFSRRGQVQAVADDILCPSQQTTRVEHLLHLCFVTSRGVCRRWLFSRPCGLRYTAYRDVLTQPQFFVVVVEIQFTFKNKSSSQYQECHLGMGRMPSAAILILGPQILLHAFGLLAMFGVKLITIKKLPTPKRARHCLLEKAYSTLTNRKVLNVVCARPRNYYACARVYVCVCIVMCVCTCVCN